MRRLKTAGGSQATSDLERVIEACDVLLRAGAADVYKYHRDSHKLCLITYELTLFQPKSGGNDWRRIGSSRLCR
jgi:hypothetical protein